MATFHGTLRLAAEPDAVHSATVILVDDRFVLRAAGAEVGDWQLQELSFDYAGEDIRVRIDGDEALLSMPERGAFAAAVGLSESAPSVARPDPIPVDREPQPEASEEVESAPEEPAGTTEVADSEYPLESGSVGVAAASAVGEAHEAATADDPTPGSEEPGPGFAVGAGGNPSASPEPLEASAEPAFSVGVPSGDDPSAGPPASDSLTPPPAPWDQLTPEALETSPGILDAAATAGAAADSPTLPDPASPEPPVAGDLQANDLDDVIPSPADAVSQADLEPVVDEPGEPPDTNNLPVEAAGAAAAVWGVRNPPEPAAPSQPDEPAAVGEGSDFGREDLVAARLAAQRESPLDGPDAATPADVSVASLEADPAADTSVESPLISEPDTDDDGDSVVDEVEEDSGDRLNRLRTQSAAGYLDDETLRKWVAWGLLIGGVIIGIGAILTWGDARMFDTDFPVARALAAVSALAAVAGFVLGFFMHRRTEGAYVAGTGAALGLMTLFIYGRAAGIGTGFFIALLGVLVVAGLAVLAITPAGGSQEKRTGR